MKTKLETFAAYMEPLGTPNGAMTKICTNDLSLTYIDSFPFESIKLFLYVVHIISHCITLQEQAPQSSSTCYWKYI